MFLTPEELYDLTHRQRAPAQCRALRSMGIEHRTRADGSVAVLRAHVERILDGGQTAARQPKVKALEPNWGAMHAKT